MTYERVCLCTAQPISIVLRCAQEFDRSIIGRRPIDDRLGFRVIDDSARIEEAMITWISIV
jgi:hypothetical protein